MCKAQVVSKNLLKKLNFHRLTEKMMLKEGCYIDANAVTLYGVTIGEYTVIGADTVLMKDIPSCTIVSGSAKEIKKINK